MPIARREGKKPTPTRVAIHHCFASRRFRRMLPFAWPSALLPETARACQPQKWRTTQPSLKWTRMPSLRRTLLRLFACICLGLAGKCWPLCFWNAIVTHSSRSRPELYVPGLTPPCVDALQNTSTLTTPVIAARSAPSPRQNCHPARAEARWMFPELVSTFSAKVLCCSRRLPRSSSTLRRLANSWRAANTGSDECPGCHCLRGNTLLPPKACCPPPGARQRPCP